MGAHGLRGTSQVLVVGSEGAGKTTLLFSETLDDIQPTQGYNLVEKTIRDKDSLTKRMCFWDVSGKDALKPLWPSYYKNIHFSGVIFVIDSKNLESLESSVKELHFLTNEEELRDAAFLVLFNMRNPDHGQERRKKSILKIICRRHDIHLSTKINFYEFDFKGYNVKTKKAFEWIYSFL